MWLPCKPFCLSSFMCFCCRSLLNFSFCLLRVLKWCLSLPTSMKSSHLSIHSLLNTLLKSSLHVSLRAFSMFRVLFIDLTLSLSKDLSAFLIIWSPLGVLIFCFRHILTGTRSSARHLRVNLRWLEKSAIFLSYFSHQQNFLTLSLSYSLFVGLLVCWWHLYHLEEGP